LNPNVLGSVDRFRVCRFRRRAVAYVAHDLGFVYAPAGGTRVDQIVSPKTIVYGGVVARRAGEEVVQQFGQLGCVRRSLRKDSGG
jgi:hypothetical protein